MIDPSAPAQPSYGTMGEVVHTSLTIRAEFASRAPINFSDVPRQRYAGSGLSTDRTLQEMMQELVKIQLAYADALIAALNGEAK